MNICILTISDTRTDANDTSGDLLSESARQAGHNVVDRCIKKDCIYTLRATVSQWVANPNVDVVLTTGGTGMTGRDSTPEALTPLFDKEIHGFGELFRTLSYEDIGPSTIQSRAVAGLANQTLIFSLPGSTGAVRLGWSKIIGPQLDSSTKPCNFANLKPRFSEK